MEGMATALVIVAIIGFFAFRQWIQHQRRVLIHRERVVAIEKGIALPAVEQEIERRSWNVQRILLLMGLIWVALGVTAFLALALIQAPGKPPGLQLIGLAPIGIGISHLIVYHVGAKRDSRQ